MILIVTIIVILPVIIFSNTRPAISYYLNTNGVYTINASALELTSDKVYKQSFASPVSRLVNIGIFVETNNRENTGYINATLSKKDEIISKSIINISDIHDNLRLNITFESTLSLVPGEIYDLELHAPDSETGNCVALRLIEGADVEPLYVNGELLYAMAFDVRLIGNLHEFYNFTFWTIYVLLIIIVSVFTVFFEKLYRPRYILPLLGVFSFVLFYSYSIIVTWDTAHYLSYVPIIEGTLSMDYWNAVRGFTYPLFLFIINKSLGEPVTSMLIVHYFLYIATLYTYYLIAEKLLPLNTINKKLTTGVLIYIIIGLNPLVFGYYHVMLTEFIASLAVAVIIYLALVYYEKEDSQEINRSYKLSILFIVILSPMLYFLRQNYLMMSLCVVLSIILIVLIQKCSIRSVFRALRLFMYTLIALIISITIWNNILPNVDDSEDYSVLARQPNRLLLLIFVPTTSDFIQFTTSDYADMRVSFFDINGKLVDDYVVDGIQNISQLSVPDAINIFFKNITRQPMLTIRGFVDSYLTGSNWYHASTADGVVYRIDRSRSPMLRGNENMTLGSFTFYSEEYSNVYHVSPSLQHFVDPFVHKKTAGVTVTDFFWRMSILSNILFTIGFLLLPFIWIGSFAFLFFFKKETAFVIAFISSSISFGYRFLNAISQSLLDRYSFPVYISTWIAIFALGVGIYKVLSKRRKTI
jgi:hypothetical protein